MPWPLKSDNWPEQPQHAFVELEPEDESLYDRMHTYCARNLTDGHVPLAQVPMIANPRHAGDRLHASLDRLMQGNPVTGDALVERTTVGFFLRYYLQDNKPRDEVLRLRAKENSKKAAQRAAIASRVAQMSPGDSRGDSPVLSPGDSPSPSPSPVPSTPVLKAQEGYEPARGEEPDYEALRHTGARRRSQTPDVGPESLADIASQVLRHAHRREASA